MRTFRRDVKERVLQAIFRAAGPDWPDEAMLEIIVIRMVNPISGLLSRGYVAAMNTAVKTGRFTKEEAVEQAAFMVLVAIQAGVTQGLLPAVTVFRPKCRTCGKYHPYVECPDCEEKRNAKVV